ncbi:hypothetical protein Q1695_012532 [Nippostrongylus brasiliensis]|nr:hypothetical protein Q1695_012532 [Nippostrongylus brasiliensis]
MDSSILLPVLEAVVVLLLLDEDRAYVNEAHVPYLDMRFRILDAYLSSLNPSSFYKYVRLYPYEFEALHDRLASKLRNFVTHRAPISSTNRLCLFLRLIAHGTSYSHLWGEFAIGATTARKNVHEVARTIIEELHSETFPTPTASTWANAVQEFRRQWDYPAAMGALDGKHVTCVCPANTGSTFYNYKGYYSIVLLALVDANYRCVIYDLGASGRLTDAGVFMNSAMKAFLEEHDCDFPGPVDLGSAGRVPCHFLVDQGFRLTPRFLRPYSSTETAADPRKAYYNYKLSSARRVVENYFGILASRFRVLLRPMNETPDNIKTLPWPSW